MKIIVCVKFIIVCVCCAIAGQLVVEARENFRVDYMYRNTENGEDIVSMVFFANSLYFPNDGENYCIEDHKEPVSGARYAHGHTFNLFVWPDEEGFINTSHNNDLVTTQKSDWAWDAHYGVPCASSSTFVGNCVTIATGQPTCGTESGYLLWTVESSQCEETDKKKSYKDPDPNRIHFIEITGTYIPPGTENCVIVQTTEKDCSSGVYTLPHTPGINANNVRKTK